MTFDNRQDLNANDQCLSNFSCKLFYALDIRQTYTLYPYIMLSVCVFVSALNLKLWRVWHIFIWFIIECVFDMAIKTISKWRANLQFCSKNVSAGCRVSTLSIVEIVVGFIFYFFIFLWKGYKSNNCHVVHIFAAFEIGMVFAITT